MSNYVVEINKIGYNRLKVRPYFLFIGYLTTLYQLRGNLTSKELVIAR